MIYCAGDFKKYNIKYTSSNQDHVSIKIVSHNCCNDLLGLDQWFWTGFASEVLDFTSSNDPTH